MDAALGPCTCGHERAAHVRKGQLSVKPELRLPGPCLVCRCKAFTLAQLSFDLSGGAWGPPVSLNDQGPQSASAPATQPPAGRGDPKP